MEPRPGAETDQLPIGDPARRRIGRAVYVTTAAAIVFFLYTAPTKQMHFLYDHAPWTNDPYDTVYSFSMFFVPLVTAFYLVQVSLCRRSEPLPRVRATNILRGCRVVALTMVVALGTDWLAVAFGANRSAWTANSTGVLIAGLTVCTVCSTYAGMTLLAAPRIGAGSGAAQQDWLDDAFEAGKRQARRLGGLRPLILRLADWLDLHVVPEVRRHPVTAAFLASAAFGIAVGTNQGVREGYLPSLTLLVIAVLLMGMFAFTMVAGSYLGVIHSSRPLSGLRRRLLDAAIVGCIGAIAALAFRDWLRWIVNTHTLHPGVAPFLALLLVVSGTAFGTAFVVESVLRAHSHPSNHGM